MRIARRTLIASVLVAPFVAWRAAALAGGAIARRVAKTGGEASNIPAALAAVGDASAARRYTLNVAPGIYTEVGWHTRNFVDIVGGDRATTILRGELPDSATAKAIENTSTVWLDQTARLENLTITAHNLRYAIHLETNGHVPGAVHEIINCTVSHLGNTAPANTWKSDFAVGAGLSSGVHVRVQKSSFSARRGAFSYHTNVNFRAPSMVEITDCDFSVKETGGAALIILPLGSGQRDQCVLIGNRLHGAIRYGPSPWLPTTLAEQPADHAEIKISGHGNGQVVFVNTDFGLALMIASASTGPGASVRVSGDAVPLLFGDGTSPKLTTVPGSPGRAAFVYGWGDISGKPVGLKQDVTITSLAHRLGNCERRPRALQVAIDGAAPVTVRFAQDCSGMSNDAIIDLIAQALGRHATVGTYAPGARYRPHFADQEAMLHNASDTAIAMGSVVASGETAGTVRLMTADDHVSARAGVTWEDIPAQQSGRVKHTGLLAASDVRYVDAAAISRGDQLSIHPEQPGALHKHPRQGVLAALHVDVLTLV